MAETSPTFEGSSLLHRILPLGLSVAVLPSDTHPEAPLHVQGKVAALLRPTLVAATDAAMSGHIHSCAVVL